MPLRHDTAVKQAKVKNAQECILVKIIRYFPKVAEVGAAQRSSTVTEKYRFPLPVPTGKPSVFLHISHLMLTRDATSWWWTYADNQSKYHLHRSECTNDALVVSLVVVALKHTHPFRAGSPERFIRPKLIQYRL